MREYDDDDYDDRLPAGCGLMIAAALCVVFYIFVWTMFFS